VFKKYSIEDTFKIDPTHFGSEIEEIARDVLQAKYEGTIDKDLGLIVAVFNIRNIGDGIVYPGDPATHHSVEFDILAYMPMVDEIVVGEVSELAEFGAFVRIGPMDGLVHVSQITTDFLSFDRKALTFVARRGGKSLKKGDVVYAKISTVSMKNSIKDSKVALSMRPEGLGKLEWIMAGQKAAGKHQKGKGRRGR